MGRTLMRVLMPLMMKTVMRPAPTLGWMHRFRIAWDEKATSIAALKAA
jgi:hypothetical protein